MTTRITAEQLNLDLPSVAATGRDDFLEAPSNRLALAAVENPAGLPAGLLVLSGPKGAGKTHLGQIWATRVDAAQVTPEALAAALPGLLDGPRAVLIDDAERVAGTEAEEALFHLINHLRGSGQLLLCARGPVRDWGLTLPDLVSRLTAAAHVSVHEPDEALLAAVMVKLFADRQLRVQPPVIDYLISRIERSLAAAGAVVAALDARALRLKRPVTRALAQELLADAPDSEPDPDVLLSGGLDIAGRGGAS
ncbi:MAG: DnaA regulatory inactivator HdaA [Pararhodobacter sp.]